MQGFAVHEQARLLSMRCQAVELWRSLAERRSYCIVKKARIHLKELRKETELSPPPVGQDGGGAQAQGPASDSPAEMATEFGKGSAGPQRNRRRKA